VGVLQFPSYCIEDSRESVFCHTATEQRVCRQGAECVIADLVVGRRCALAYEVKVGVGAERRSVEEDKPCVCAEVRLRIALVNGCMKEKWPVSFEINLLCRRCWLVRHLAVQFDESHPDRLQRRHAVVLVVEGGRDVSCSRALHCHCH
jgi:hypothetical protein